MFFISHLEPTVLIYILSTISEGLSALGMKRGLDGVSFIRGGGEGGCGVI